MIYIDGITDETGREIEDDEILVIAIGEAMHETEDMSMDIVIFSNNEVYLGTNIIDDIEYGKTVGVIEVFESLDNLKDSGWIPTVTKICKPILEIKVIKLDSVVSYKFNTYRVSIFYEVLQDETFITLLQQTKLVARIPIDEIRGIKWKNLAPISIGTYDDTGVKPLYTITISRT